jgi:hypothetical protein
MNLLLLIALFIPAYPYFATFFSRGRTLIHSVPILSDCTTARRTIMPNTPDHHDPPLMRITGSPECFLFTLLRPRFLRHQIITMAPYAILVLHVRNHLMNRLGIVTPFTDPDILAPLVLTLMTDIAPLKGNAMVGILNADNLDPIDSSRLVAVLAAIRGGC